MGSGQWSGRAVVSFHLFSGAANRRHPGTTNEEWEDVNYTLLSVITSEMVSGEYTSPLSNDMPAR